MKVLTLNSTDNSGGAARAAYRIHSGVRQQGVDSVYLVKHKTIHDDQSIVEASQFERKHVARQIELFTWKIKNRINKQKWKKYNKKKNFFLSDLFYVPLNKALDQFDYDVLHLHWITNQYLDIRELTRIKKPIVWTLHDCWPFTGICHYFYDCTRYESECGCCPMLNSNGFKDLSHKIFKKKQSVYKSCNIHVVSPSRWLGNAAGTSQLFRKFPVTVIPNAIDTNLYCPGNRDRACEKLSLDPGTKKILYGAMNAVKDQRKGFSELLAAMSFFKKETGCGEVELVMFGAEPDTERVETGIPANNLGVIRDDEKMVAAYQAADVMVVPSLSENLSNVIMESLSCGTPVVAFDIGGNADLIDHKTNGYLAEAVSAKDLAAGIKWCLENRLAENLSDHARAKVEQNYTVEIISKRYKEMYASLIF